MRVIVIGIVVSGLLMVWDLSGELKPLRSALELGVTPVVMTAGKIRTTVFAPIQSFEFTQKGMRRLAELEATQQATATTAAELDQLKKENALLRTQLSAPRFTVQKGAPLLIPTVLIGGVTTTIPVGTAQGVREGAMVIADGSVLGFVEKTSLQFSSIEGISHLHHKISVHILNGPEGVLERQSNGQLTVSHLGKDLPIDLGAVVVTSGDDRGTLPGIAVGKVLRVTSGESDVTTQVEIEVYVEPKADQSVFVLQTTEAK